jgi:hypothetical protein
MRKRVGLTIVGLAVASSLMLPAVAEGSHDPSGAPFAEDFATGVQRFTFCDPFIGCFTETDTFDAHSGPSGENPRGSVTVATDGAVLLTGRVTCLTVTGNRATVGVEFPGFGSFLTFLEDNAAAGIPDRFGAQPVSTAPTVCPDNPTGASSSVNGNFVVHDAVLPTSIDQCKNGGWRNFPGFKNQGDCVSFVATRGRNQPSGSQGGSTRSKPPAAGNGGFFAVLPKFSTFLRSRLGSG